MGKENWRLGKEIQEDNSEEKKNQSLQSSELSQVKADMEIVI